MRNYFRSALRRLGYDLVRLLPPEATLPPDLSPEETRIWLDASRYTMTGVDRAVSLMRAVGHVVHHQVAGDIVECGVWKGGSMMMVAYMLRHLGDTRRDLFLFDTFEGMPPPSDKDARYDGAGAARLLEGAADDSWLLARAGLDAVRANLASTGYPAERMHYVQGKVEDTIPQQAPARIALLRLDTDWYESTKHELTHLYPRLATGGILIIDDYGHWRGARQAADEYFAGHAPAPFLHRIDYTARLLVKTS